MEGMGLRSLRSIMKMTGIKKKSCNQSLEAMRRKLIWESFSSHIKTRLTGTMCFIDCKTKQSKASIIKSIFILGRSSRF